ncbi:hypothetical protein D1007_30871 [Hordeum vulgare]|nr:hypothetical protein D1007_30871 [Hordeum vulgare]
MTLLHSEGAPEVVMWDPLEQLVLAVDLDGRVTRSIAPSLAGPTTRISSPTSTHTQTSTSVVLDKTFIP